MNRAQQPEFLERCEEIEGATLGDGAFGDGVGVWVGTREVAHFDRDDTLDIRLTRGVIRLRRAELQRDPRIVLRKNISDWMEFTIASSADADDAFALVQEAVAANEPTAPPGPPPTGADLARRRRFH